VDSGSGDQQPSKIVLLGTGTPNAEPERSGPSVAIVVNGAPYIVDFGPGVVRRAAAAYAAGVKALDMPQLTRAFLTHLHSDHTAGYADLILTPWVLERDEPLQVYGPAGNRAMTEHILAAYREDIRERLDGLEPVNDTGYRVDIHEVEPGIIYRDASVWIEAFPVRHGSWPAFGFKFHTPDRTIVISGILHLRKASSKRPVVATFWYTRSIRWQDLKGISQPGKGTIPAFTPQHVSLQNWHRGLGRACSFSIISFSGASQRKSFCWRSKRDTMELLFQAGTLRCIEIAVQTPG